MRILKHVGSKQQYNIVEADDGSVYCTCPAWRFQVDKAPKDRTCKHLDAFFGKTTHINGIDCRPEMEIALEKASMIWKGRASA